MRLLLLPLLAACSVVPLERGKSPEILALDAEIARLDAEIASLRADIALLRSAPAPTAPVESEARCVPPELKALLLDSVRLGGRILLHRGPDGSFDGYRLSAIRTTDVLHEIGFKNGDILQRINGEPFSSISEVMILHQRYLKEGPPEQVTVDLLREGQPHRIELHFGSCVD